MTKAPDGDIVERLRAGFFCREEAADEIERLRAALRIFLGEEDERFQVAIGGNPIAVEKMLQEARALVGGRQ